MNLTDIIEIIVGSLTAAGLFFAGLSYFLSRKSYKKQYEYNVKEKALEIADQMAVLISKDIYAILQPFNSGKGKEFIEYYFSNIDAAVFDYNGIQELLVKPAFNKYKDPDELFKAYAFSIQDYFYNINKKRLENAEEIKEATVKDVGDFADLQGLTLNKIEAMSMYLCLEMADEEILYPAIHQVFLKFVKICSLLIAITNKTSFDEYYKYTIELYHKWNKRQINHTNEKMLKKENEENVSKNKFIK